MRLKSLSLTNFRCFPDEAVDFETYTALVGANNAGKSALVAALDIFFRSSSKNIPLTVDDFFKRDVNRELQIRLTFADLSDPAVEEFSHYVRSGELTFFIKANVENGQVRASIHGVRLANPDFAPFFEKTTAADKKEVYDALKAKYELPKWQNQTQAADALRAFENAPENEGMNKPIPSDDKAFGVEGPVSRLRQFIDFVYIPAVKDAGDEAVEARNTAFSKLIERAVRAKLKIDERIEKIRSSAKSEIEVMAQDHQQVLTSLASMIEGQYRRFNSFDSKIHLDWGQFDERSLQISLPAVHLQVSDDLIRNSIVRFGHGTQRNYLLALLMVSASYDFTELQTIIIACEEPELYQHPPQARVLANSFFSLASNQAQIIVTTHSPHFVTAKSFANVRLIRRTLTQRSQSYSWSVDENCALVAKAKGEAPIGLKAAMATINQFLQPQMNEMFFAQNVIFVEGDEDRSVLDRYLQLSGKYQQLLALGVNIVPTSGKGNLINALSVARGLQIPNFVIFDADMNVNTPENIKLNSQILSVVEYDGPGKTGKLDAHVMYGNFCIWKDCLQAAIIEDVPDWEQEKAQVCVEFGWTVDRLRKNPMVLEATLDRVYKKAAMPKLDSLCVAIMQRFSGITVIEGDL